MLANNEPLRLVFEKTACYLSGKTITLHFRHPDAKSGVWRMGEFYFDGGKFHIDIDPDLMPVQACAIALHEIAHAKRHAHMAEKVTPRIVQAAQNIERVNVARFEDEADSLANKWWTFARNYSDVKTSSTDAAKATAYMTTLLFYKG